MARDMEAPASHTSIGLLPFSNLSFPLMTQRENYYTTRNDSYIEPSNNIEHSHDISDFWMLATSDNLRQSVGWSLAMIIAYSTIFVIGIIGNILVILVMIFKSPMRTVTSMFLINLAVADLLVIVFCVPATLLSNLFIPWVLGSFMCKGVAYVQGVSVCASAYSLAALSFDRCKAIYRPMERHQGLSKYQALLTILLIWIFSLLITLPWLFAFEVVESEELSHVYCLEVWGSEHHGKVYFLVANLIFCYVVPFMIICISNVAIWCHVSKREVPQDSVSVKRVHKKTRKDLRKTLGIVTSAFLISWFPLYALATHIKFKSVKDIGEWEGEVLSFLLPIAQWLGSLNSSLNPVLYAFINSKFRRGFQTLLRSLVSKDYFSLKSESYYRRRSQKALRRQNAVRQRSLNNNRIEIGKVNKRSDGALQRVDL